MEKEIYTEYELEQEKQAQRDKVETVNNTGTSKEEEKPEGTAGEPEKEDEGAKAAKEIEKMIDEMGAEKLLSIIVGNRNSAIEQIISEMSASESRLPSGTSVAKTMNSIFDLASLA